MRLTVTQILASLRTETTGQCITVPNYVNVFIAGFSK